MLRYVSVFIITIILIACRQSDQFIPAERKEAGNKPPEKITVSNVADTNITYDSVILDRIYYGVKVDEGYDYKSLKTTCENAAVFLNYPVDYLERVYKPGRGIVLPDDYEDPYYNGKYVPRRPFQEQNFVSIEMKSFYREYYKYEDKKHMKMMVIANIFNDKASADSLVSILKPEFKNAETYKMKIWMGCMH